MISSNPDDSNIQTTEHFEQEPEADEDDVEEEDMKEVVIILQEQVTLKAREISELKAQINDLKRKHEGECDKL